MDLTALTVDSEAEAEDEAGAMRDLDADMDAALADAGLASGELPEFAASNSRAPASADVTRIAFDSETPRGDVDEIEDLFVELIEE
jgi:hypothetical protein